MGTPQLSPDEPLLLLQVRPASSRGGFGAKPQEGKREAGGLLEIWTLELHAEEDHRVRLGAPCLPIFYAAPENILIKRDER